MKATEHLSASKSQPKVTPKEELKPKGDERPPEKVSEIEKQMNILEEQSLTSRQEAAIAEIRNILGIAPESPEVDNTLPVPEPEPAPEEAKAPAAREEDHSRHSHR